MDAEIELQRVSSGSVQHERAAKAATSDAAAAQAEAAALRPALELERRERSALDVQAQDLRSQVCVQTFNNA